MTNEHLTRANGHLQGTEWRQPLQLALDEDLGTLLGVDAQRSLRQRHDVRGHLTRFDRELRIFAVAVMGVDEPQLVLSRGKRDMSVVARPNLLVASEDLDRDFC